MSHSRDLWGLNGCWIIFTAHFRTEYWYLCFNMPLESLQTDFSNKTHAILKTNTHLFLAFCSSILKLLYLCNFGSPRSEILSYGSPLSLFSNPTIQTEIRFFKKGLCPISHDDLIIDWFSRVNLYEVPCVTVSTLGPEIDTKKTKFRPLSVPVYKISIWCSERKLWLFSPGHLFWM